jgi:hypothetical protein
VYVRISVKFQHPRGLVLRESVAIFCTTSNRDTVSSQIIL